MFLTGAQYLKVGDLMSVWLWNFKNGGSLKATFLPKNQYIQRKPLYFESTGSTCSPKIGHDFIKQSGSKIEVFYKNWSPKLILLNVCFLKNSVDF